MDQIIASGATPRYLLPPEEARRQVLVTFTEQAGESEPVYFNEDRYIDTQWGPVRVRHYVPSKGGIHPALLYFHGGGWRFGSIETHDAVCCRLANGCDSAIISVDYSLSPEAHFPQALGECYAVLQYVYNNSRSLDIDQNRIAVGGDSAGGNLAAALALLARDRGGPPICFQVLVYPVTAHYSAGLDSYKRNSEGLYLVPQAMQIYWDSYIKDPQDAKNPYAAPLEAENLAGLPPALVVLAEYDPLYDEGELYARKLQEAGVPAKIIRFEGVMHGFWTWNTITDVALKAQQEVVRELREVFGQ
jgi:acetyl esterase